MTVDTVGNLRLGPFAKFVMALFTTICAYGALMVQNTAVEVASMRAQIDLFNTQVAQKMEQIDRRVERVEDRMNNSVGLPRSR